MMIDVNNCGTITVVISSFWLMITAFSFSTQKAYICNFRQHWFCVRKLGNQWFNLNSLLTGPELISNTYLSLFLTQLQQEGKIVKEYIVSVLFVQIKEKMLRFLFCFVIYMCASCCHLILIVLQRVVRVGRFIPMTTV
jgi:hypothetical protein